MVEKKGKSKLEIKVIKVEGQCPVYKVGEKTIIDGPTINLKQSDAVCIHALFSLGTFIVALREGVSPANIGLAKTDNEPAYFHCPDPGKPRTNGGTVLFEVKRI